LTWKLQLQGMVCNFMNLGENYLHSFNEESV